MYVMLGIMIIFEYNIQVHMYSPVASCLQGPCSKTCTHIHCTIMLTELLYPLQYGDTPLHLAAREGHTTCVEHLIHTHGIDMSTNNKVSNSYLKLIAISSQSSHKRSVNFNCTEMLSI